MERSLADLGGPSDAQQQSGMSLAGLGRWGQIPASQNVEDLRGSVDPLSLHFGQPLQLLGYNDNKMEARVPSPLAEQAGHSDIVEFDGTNGYPRSTAFRQSNNTPLDNFSLNMLLQQAMLPIPAWLRNR